MQQLSKRFNAVAPLAYSNLINRYYSLHTAPTFKSLARPTVFDTTKLSALKNSMLPIAARQFSTYFSWKKIIFGPPFSIDLEKGRINFHYPKNEIKYFHDQIVSEFILLFDKAYKLNDLNKINVLLKCMFCDEKIIIYYDKDDPCNYAIFSHDRKDAIINYAFCAVQNRNYDFLRIFVGHNLFLKSFDHDYTNLIKFVLINQDIKATKILLQCKYRRFNLYIQNVLCKIIDEKNLLLNHSFVSELYKELLANCYVDYETNLKIRKYLGLEKESTSEQSAKKDGKKEKSNTGTSNTQDHSKKKQTPNRFESADPYIIFNIHQANYTKAEIKAFYRKLAKEFHPDSSNTDSTQIMQKINAAREMLLAKCKN